MGCNCSSNRQEDEFYFQKLTENLNLYTISDEEYLESISNWIESYKKLNKRKVNSSIQLNKIIEDNKEYLESESADSNSESVSKGVFFNEIYIDLVTNNENENDIRFENESVDPALSRENSKKYDIGNNKNEKRNIRNNIRYTIEHISNIKSILNEEHIISNNKQQTQTSTQIQTQGQRDLFIYLINNIFKTYIICNDLDIDSINSNTENLSIPSIKSSLNKEKEIKLNYISSIRNHLEVNTDSQIEFIIIIVLLTKYNSNESIINSFGCLVKLIKNINPYRIEAGVGLIKYKFFIKGLVLLLRTFTSLAVPYAYSMYQALNASSNTSLSNGLLEYFNEVYSEDVVKYYVSSRYESKMMNYSIAYFQKAVLPQIGSVCSIVKSIFECNEEYKYYKRRRVIDAKKGNKKDYITA